jgi:branched-chain amino acid transport system ATP-binding protein
VSISNGIASEGQRKLAGVARALAGTPRLLYLDEPAAGLDARESEELGRRLRELADQGQSTLLIDHDMGLVLGICDRVVVLQFGRVIADGPPHLVRDDPAVIAAYLGARSVPVGVLASPDEGERGAPAVPPEPGAPAVPPEPGAPAVPPEPGV